MAAFYKFCYCDFFLSSFSPFCAKPSHRSHYVHYYLLISAIMSTITLSSQPLCLLLPSHCPLLPSHRRHYVHYYPLIAAITRNILKTI